MLLIALAGLAVLADRSAAAEEPRARLRRCLGARAYPARNARWGVMVKDVASGEVLFAHNAHLFFNPASNIKLITSAAVLRRFGPDHRFVTEVFGQRERGTIKGGLYLRGWCDPSLTTDSLARMAQRLRKLGVRRIRGPLYLDTSAFEGPSKPPGFRRFRSSHPFRAGVSALSLNGNVVRISVIPGAPGERARVHVAPPSPYIQLNAAVRTTRRYTRLRVSTHPRRGATWVTVKGRINHRARPRVYWRRVYDPALYTAGTFLVQLRRAGIRVGRRIGKRRVPSGTPRLMVSESPTLASIVRTGTKHSSNVVAEHLLLQLGGDRFGWPTSFEKGLKALERYVRSLGLPPGEHRFENGSGLSRRSLIRPADLVRILEGIYRDFGARPEVLAALPVAGLDGTLRRRFGRSRAKGLVRAKTGTLSGVSCLSGYAGYQGHVLAFAFMAGRARRMATVRWKQEAMAGCLVDYLRSRATAARRP